MVQMEAKAMVGEREGMEPSNVREGGKRTGEVDEQEGYDM